jgi:lipoate-protein ligase A
MDAYPRATWRLIESNPAGGPSQMATDEAIWRAVAAGRVPPTLRLYAWEPPCLSLGRGQPIHEVDQQALARAGYDLVRRPTGGRAILHTDELTYSVSIPLSDPRVRGGVLSSCESLSAGLRRALTDLGVQNVAPHRSIEDRGQPAPVCFETPGAFEIVAGGKKLIGSAQMRGREAVLQHGTLPLRGDLTRICAFLTVPVDAGLVRDRAATLEAALGRFVPWGAAARAVAKGFARALNLDLEPGQLTTWEQRTAGRLEKEKYRAERWTAKV